MTGIKPENPLNTTDSVIIIRLTILLTLKTDAHIISSRIQMLIKKVAEMSTLFEEQLESLFTFAEGTKNVVENTFIDYQSKYDHDAFRNILQQLTNVGILDQDQFVCGKSIGDIPTSYRIPAVQRHEKAVVGTFVDKHIVPGFKYFVRINGSLDYLFDCKAITLQRIGIGYGKRLTFKSDSLLTNDNFFWSDSSELGYAFSVSVIDVNSVFEVYMNEICIGECRVTSVKEEQEIISSQDNFEQNIHEKEVLVKFTCSFFVQEDKTFVSEVIGLVKMVKQSRSENAEIKDIHALPLSSPTRILLKPKLISYY